MANITDQFVTSFSELYYSTTPISAANAAKPTPSEVRNWFSFTGTDATAKIQSYAITSGSLSQNLVLSLDILDENGNVLDNIATNIQTGDTISDAVVNWRLNLTSSDYISAVAGTGSNLLVTFTKLAGNATIAAGDPVTIVAGSAPTTDFAAGTGGTHLIPLVMEIGTLSNEATVIDTPTFGEEFRGKLRGQLDGGQLDSQLYWAPRNAIHQELREISIDGRKVYVGIKWNTSATGADSEFVYFDSFVSSFGIDTTFDDVAKVSLTLVVDGAEHFASSTD